MCAVFVEMRVDRLVKPTFEIRDLPKGWLTPLEPSVLYNAALNAKGPLMELGSWIGRSTCALATGVRDNRNAPVFDIYDYGIAGIREWMWRYGIDPRTHESSEDFLEVIMHPGGTAALLKKNLIERNLEQYVNTIVLGDFKKASVARKYSVCFGDASHDEKEIRSNLPFLCEMIDHRHFLTMFDDVWSLDYAKLVADMNGADYVICLHQQDSPSKMTITTRGDYNAVAWISRT